MSLAEKLYFCLCCESWMHIPRKKTSLTDHLYVKLMTINFTFRERLVRRNVTLHRNIILLSYFINVILMQE